MVDYVDNQKDVIIICPEHDEFIQKPFHHVRGSGCPSCSLSKRSKIDWYEFTNRLYKKFGKRWKYSCNKWGGIFNSIIEVKCDLHGEKNTHSNNLLKLISPCDECSKIISKSGEGKKSDEKWRELWDGKKLELNNIHNNKYDYSKVIYKGVSSKIKIICPKHGEFNQLFRSHYYDLNGCPKCNSSKGEVKISNILTTNNVKFQTQKKFNPLGRKSFDFYLPEYNLCIEYDGRQHFESIDHFGGKESLKTQKCNDKVKNKFCENNNIDLLRIPYWEYDKIEYIVYEKIIKYHDK